MRRAGVHIAEIADRVITGLREQGYRFATVAELLAGEESRGVVEVTVAPADTASAAPTHRAVL